jgi:hypothetical protein
MFRVIFNCMQTMWLAFAIPFLPPPTHTHTHKHTHTHTQTHIPPRNCACTQTQCTYTCNHTRAHAAPGSCFAYDGVGHWAWCPHLRNCTPPAHRALGHPSAGPQWLGCAAQQHIHRPRPVQCTERSRYRVEKGLDTFWCGNR